MAIYRNQGALAFYRLIDAIKQDNMQDRIAIGGIHAHKMLGYAEMVGTDYMFNSYSNNKFIYNKYGLTNVYVQRDDSEANGYVVGIKEDIDYGFYDDIHIIIVDTLNIDCIKEVNGIKYYDELSNIESIVDIIHFCILKMCDSIPPESWYNLSKVANNVADYTYYNQFVMVYMNRYLELNNSISKLKLLLNTKIYGGYSMKYYTEILNSIIKDTIAWQKLTAELPKSKDKEYRELLVHIQVQYRNMSIKTIDLLTGKKIAQKKYNGSVKGVVYLQNILHLPSIRVSYNNDSGNAVASEIFVAYMYGEVTETDDAIYIKEVGNAQKFCDLYKNTQQLLLSYSVSPRVKDMSKQALDKLNVAYGTGQEQK